MDRFFKIGPKSEDFARAPGIIPKPKVETRGRPPKPKEDKEEGEEVKEKRGPGRPPKVEIKAEPVAAEEGQAKRGPGRPLGAKGKKEEEEEDVGEKAPPLPKRSRPSLSRCLEGVRQDAFERVKDLEDTAILKARQRSIKKS